MNESIKATRFPESDLLSICLLASYAEFEPCLLSPDSLDQIKLNQKGQTDLRVIDRLIRVTTRSVEREFTENSIESNITSLHFHLDQESVHVFVNSNINYSHGTPA